MKRLSIITILLLPLILFATTYTVDINGGQDFTSIQSAIYAAHNGDRIIVYPGVYHEFVHYFEKNLIIASLELTTGDPSYIAQTVIDGDNERRCVNIYNLNQDSALEGFTIRNGYFGAGPAIVSAGIMVSNTHHFTIKNCHIYHNFSEQGNGGIKIEACDNITLSGLSIHDNRSSGGTGLYIYRSTNVIFDSENRCSVYNNVGGNSVDVFYYVSPQDIAVILDTVSVSNPGDFFITNVQDLDNPSDMTVEYQHYMYEEIDHDLYVAPDGDNNNDGLTPETPLQCIQKAVYLIKSNPDNPHTIHLASGDYSKNLNNQLYPIGIKSYVKMVGSENTNILGDDDQFDSMLGFYYTTGNELKNIDFTQDDTVPKFGVKINWQKSHLLTQCKKK